MSTNDDANTNATLTNLRRQDLAARTASEAQQHARQRVPAGVAALLVGWLGVHKFVLGYPVQGIAMLATTAACAAIGGHAWWGIGLVAAVAVVEGVIYLRMADRDFATTYAISRRGWF